MHFLVLLSAIGIIVSFLRGLSVYLKLRHIPTCGSTSLPLLSLPDAFHFLFHATRVLQAGYDAMRDHPFKIAHLTRWVVVVASPKLIDDLRRAPEDVLSFHDATSELLQIPHTLGATIAQNPYHIPLIRQAFDSKGVRAAFREMNDEALAAIDTTLLHRIGEDNSWIPVFPTEAIMIISARASNRIFVGLPLCRNEEYLKISTQFTIAVVTAGAVIEKFPEFMKPIKYLLH